MPSAIVLGGSAGVGNAVVQQLLERGYDVGVIARGRDRLKAMSKTMGERVHVESCDVSDADALARAVADLVNRIGTPDIWINCAMATVFAPFAEVSAEEFERITDVTYHGQVNGTREALRHMGRGHIVFVGSGLAYRSVPGQSAYCGAKHAINGFFGSLRSELLRQNSDISLHLVQLPAINTPQFDWARSRLSKKPQPAPPIYAPDVAAKAVMQAIDTNAREVFVGTSVLQLVFGNMVLPDWLDRKLARVGIEQQQSDQPPRDDLDNLFEPADYDATANGSFDHRASDKGLIVDADKARKAIFFGGGLALFVLGLAIG